MKTPSEILNQATRDRFWGSLEFTFQNGAIVLIRKAETIKIRTEGTTHDNGNGTYREKA